MRLVAVSFSMVALTIAVSSTVVAQSNDLQSLLDSYPVSTSKTNAKRDVYTASTESIIATVDAALPFTVTKTSANWAYVRFGLPVVPVWVSEDYIRVSGEIATVSADRLNARLRSSLQAPILLRLDRGYTSEVLDSKNGFAKIKAPASLVVAVPIDQASGSAVAITNLEASATESVTNSTSASAGASVDVSDVASVSTAEVSTAIERADNRAVDKPGPATTQVIKKTALSTKQVTAASQQGVVKASNVAPTVPTPSSPEQSHLIAPGDAISLFVFGESDLSADNLRVPQSGTVSLPLIGSIVVGGKTTMQVEEQVRKILSQGYVNNPRLSVSIFSYRPIFIRGAVRSTGAFPYTEGLTVAKALALAGGTKNSAQAQGISILREGQTVQSDLGIDSQYQVASGDVISIAEEFGGSENAALFIYLHGEVASPGEYLYRRGLTVEKAIVLAGGFTMRGSPKKIRITRYNGVTENEEPVKKRSVKLHTPIEPGDVINVGARWF